MKSERIKNVESIEKHLRKVDYIIRKNGRMILSDFGITVPQFTALQILINDGEMTIGELSAQMDLACSTITDLIDRMEKNGLVIREKDIKDKRVVRVVVLDKGHEILQKVLVRRIEFLEDKLGNLSVLEVENLRDALEKLYLEMNEDKKVK
jgi:DNA-binding MarR family transcriptional regulator